MTTSGTATFNLEFDDIIEEAFERCGIESRTGYDMRTARRSLNLMFAEWANRGLNLWTIQQHELPMVVGQAEYSLSTDTVNLLSAVVRTGTGLTQQDVSIDRISQNEYLFVPNKLTTGRPSQYYLQRTTVPKLFVYPAPDAATTYTLVYYGIRRIEDAGSFTNNADVVFRFLPCLVAGLSYYLALKKAPDRIVMLKQLYEEEFTRAAAEDRDSASVFISPAVGN
jgi:hypothetical protein